MGSQRAVGEALEQHGFPQGLLPLCRVEAHRLGAGGEFEVRLSEAVQKSIHGNHVRYGEKITGRIGHGRITRLRVSKRHWPSLSHLCCAYLCLPSEQALWLFTSCPSLHAVAQRGHKVGSASALGAPGRAYP